MQRFFLNSMICILSRFLFRVLVYLKNYALKFDKKITFSFRTNNVVREIEKKLTNKFKIENKAVVMDQVLELVGPIGKYQKLMILLIGSLSALTAYTFFATVFINATPNLTCVNKSKNNEIVSADETCIAWNNFTASSSSSSPFHCSFDTTYFGRTVITEWSLVCDRVYLTGIGDTIYMIGSFLSLFVGFFSDRAILHRLRSSGRVEHEAVQHSRLQCKPDGFRRRRAHCSACGLVGSGLANYPLVYHCLDGPRFLSSLLLLARVAGLFGRAWSFRRGSGFAETHC